MFSEAFVTVFALALLSCVNSNTTPLQTIPGRSLLGTKTHYRCIHIPAGEWIQCNEALENSQHNLHRIVVGEDYDEETQTTHIAVNVFAETIEEAVDEAAIIFGLSPEQRVSVESLVRPGIGGTLLGKQVQYGDDESDDDESDDDHEDDVEECSCDCHHYCLNNQNTCDCCSCHKILNSWTDNGHQWTKVGTFCHRAEVSTFAQVDGSFTIYQKHHREEVPCEEAEPTHPHHPNHHDPYTYGN